MQRLVKYQLLKTEEIKTTKLSDGYEPEIKSAIDFFAYKIEDLYEYNEELYNKKEYNDFNLSIKNTADYGNNSRITVVKGAAGIGKTTFFKKGLSKALGVSEEFTACVIDVKEFAENRDIDYYKDKILKNLDDTVFPIVDGEFSEEFNDTMMGKNINNILDINKRVFAFFCKAYNDKYKTPVYIIIDNIDLCSRKTQIGVVNATFAVKTSLVNTTRAYSKSLKSDLRFCIIITKRPDTHFPDELGSFNNVMFPKPNIIKIYEFLLKKGVKETLKTKDDYDINLTVEQKEYKKFSDLLNAYIEMLLNTIMSSWQDNHIIRRFDSIENFHNLIITYNIRRFAKFIAETIRFGAIRQLNLTVSEPYTIYEHIELLIRGAYDFHAGNKKMDGESFYSRTPIIMHLFDFEDWQRKDNEYIIENYFVFVKILQYLEINSVNSNLSNVSYHEIKNYLLHFFDRKAIECAVQKLIYANIVNEENMGIRNLSSFEKWSKIDLSDEKNVQISLFKKSTSMFYLDYLVIEFEYLYNMAVSTPIFIYNDDDFCNNFIKKFSMKTDYDSKTYFIRNNKEELVYVFLKSMYNVILKNLESYENKKEIFREVFRNGVALDYMIKPYNRMLKNYISVLNGKIGYREKTQNSKKSLFTLAKLASDLLKESESKISSLLM